MGGLGKLNLSRKLRPVQERSLQFKNENVQRTFPGSLDQFKMLLQTVKDSGFIGCVTAHPLEAITTTGEQEFKRVYMAFSKAKET